MCLRRACPELAVALPALRSFSEGGSIACPELAVALSVAEGIVEWVEGVAEGSKGRVSVALWFPFSEKRNNGKTAVKFY